jgi:hypothetical protein
MDLKRTPSFPFLPPAGAVLDVLIPWSVQLISVTYVGMAPPPFGASCSAILIDASISGLKRPGGRWRPGRRAVVAARRPRASSAAIVVPGVLAGRSVLNEQPGKLSARARRMPTIRCRSPTGRGLAPDGLSPWFARKLSGLYATLRGMEVTVRQIEGIPPGNLRVPRGDFVAVWSAAERSMEELKRQGTGDCAVCDVRRWPSGCHGGSFRRAAAGSAAAATCAVLHRQPADQSRLVQRLTGPLGWANMVAGLMTTIAVVGRPPEASGCRRNGRTPGSQRPGMPSAPHRRRWIDQPHRQRAASWFTGLGRRRRGTSG